MSPDDSARRSPGLGYTHKSLGDFRYTIFVHHPLRLCVLEIGAFIVLPPSSYQRSILSFASPPGRVMIAERSTTYTKSLGDFRYAQFFYVLVTHISVISFASVVDRSAITTHFPVVESRQ